MKNSGLVTTTAILLALSAGQLVSSGARADHYIDDDTITTVDGRGALPSLSVTGQMYVGYNGVGELQISNGGAVDLSGNFIAGFTAFSTGSITVDGTGSILNVAQEMMISRMGAGSLAVSNGGRVNVGSTLLIGDNFGAATSQAGNVVIRGATSELIVGGHIYLSGSTNDNTVWATMRIEDGATVTTTLVSSIASRGNAAVTVTGPNSSWDITGTNYLLIGDNGAMGGNPSTGILTIADGGRVTAEFYAIGAKANATGSVSVTGANSLLESRGNLFIGYASTGDLTVSNGGQVRSLNIVLARDVGSSGVALATGNGTKWVSTSRFVIGNQGSGVMTLADGAIVEAPDGTTIGAAATASGLLNIGAAAGAAAVKPGSLTTPTVVFGAGPSALVFNHTATEAEGYVFGGAISGNGTVDFYSGVTTLTGASTYTGPTTIRGGIVKAGAANVFSPVSSHDVQVSAKLDLAGYDQTINTLTNAGTISFSEGLGRVATASNYIGNARTLVPGTVLTTTNYVGNNGTLVLGTVLGDDTSITDKLVIDAGTATGTSFMSIVNRGGSGAPTTGDGIMVVEAINGATTSPSAFILSGRVAAGGYDYNLYYGGNGAADENWYLRSTVILEPVPPTTTDPVAPPVIEVPAYRSEVPLLASVIPVAIEYGYAMLDTLHERGGHLGDRPMASVTEDRVIRDKRGTQRVTRTTVDPTETTRWASTGWTRLIGNRGFHDNGNFERRGPDYNYTFAGIQAGLDIYARQQADGTLDKAGLYVGYGNIDANVSGAWGGKAGSIDMDAYTLAGYWTHRSPQGWYSDAVVQGTWYSAETKSVAGQKTKPDGFGILLSLEGGYTFKLGNGLTIEPQAQIAYQSVSFDNTSDQYGRFQLSTGESLRGRIGVRLAKDWNMGDAARPRLINTWLRFNLWHEFMGSPSMTVTNLQGTNPLTVKSSLGGTWGEIGVGVSGQVSDAVTLFATGNYNHSLDNKGRQAWDGRLGLKVNW